MNELLSFVNSLGFSPFIEPGLCHYLIFSIIIFLTGLTITVCSDNIIKILIGLELMLNAVCLNFAAADAFATSVKIPEGQIFGLFIIVIGAINAAAGLGLILAIFFRLKNISADTYCSLKSSDCPEDEYFNQEGEI